MITAPTQELYTYTVHEPLICEATYYITSPTPLNDEELVSRMREEGHDDVEYDTYDFNRSIQVYCNHETPDGKSEVTLHGFKLDT